MKLGEPRIFKRIFAYLIGLLLILTILSSFRIGHSTGQAGIAVVNTGYIAPTLSWTAGPPRWVETNSFIFYTNETETGNTFCVEIRAYDVLDLQAWQINLSFDPTLLHCIRARLGDYFYPIIDIPPTPIIDNDMGYMMYGAALPLGEPALTGNVTLCWINFQLIRAPSGENETLACNFMFVDYPALTWLMNSRGEDISFSMVNGYYESRSPPRLTGDINLDGVVDMLDIGDVVTKYGMTPSSPNWDARMDINADLRVDLRDIGIVCINFGKTR
jgi:hypothetical protein